MYNTHPVPIGNFTARHLFSLPSHSHYSHCHFICFIMAIKVPKAKAARASIVVVELNAVAD